MKKPIFSAMLMLAIVSMLSSCKKDDNTDPGAPTVTITSPTEGETVTGGTVSISAMATASGDDDAHLLHEVSVKVTQGSTTVFEAVVSAHDEAMHMVDTSFTTTATGAMVLTVEAENHVPQTGTKTVNFSVN